MTERHESSCSVYNMPAYPNGPCDCKYREQNLKEHWDQCRPELLEVKRRFERALDKAVEAIRMSDQ